MTYYERAIEKYMAEKKQEYKQLLHDDVMRFVEKIKKMLKTGGCYGALCRCCPVSLAGEDGLLGDMSCGKLDKERVKKAIRMKIKGDKND